MAREMKNSGVKWIGEIPNNWNVKKVKYNFGVIGGCGFNEKYQGESQGDYPFCKASDINGLQKHVSGAANYVSKQTAIAERYNIIPVGSIIFAKIGEALKKNHRKINTVECIVDNNCQAIYQIANNDINYMYYLWKQIDMTWFDNAGTIPCVNNQRLKSFPIPIPPLPEQKAIADFLDKKCAEIDGLLADLEAEVKTLAEYKKSIIAETVTRGLNPNAPMKQSGIPWAETIPAHWTTEKGKYLFVLRRTKGNPHNLELMSPTQKFGVIPQSQVEGVVLVKEKTDLNTFRTIRPGDFCISLRSFQGGFEYSKYEGVVSPAYQVFYPIKPIADGYFKYMLKSDGFISYINTFSMSLRDGKNIAFEDFGNSYIPTPPIEEQEAIAAYLNKKCALIDQSTADKQTQIETLKSYKSSLIYEYVTGKKQVI